MGRILFLRRFRQFVIKSFLNLPQDPPVDRSQDPTQKGPDLHPLVESLEPRLLLSANTLGMGIEHENPTPYPVDNAPAIDVDLNLSEMPLSDALLVPEDAYVEAPQWQSENPPVHTPTLGGDSAPPANQAPYGANRYDTSEYMIGDVWVTVILLESDGSIDTNTEDWTSTEIDNVKAEITEGLTWWEETMRNAPETEPVHDLTFHIDFTYADNPVPTAYEPINRPQTDENLWIDDFLDHVDYNTSSSVWGDLANWNHDRRIQENAHWSYTVFVVDSSNDTNGKFSDGHFAYAYVGGPFTVMTYDNNGWGIHRMGQVFAHETGHVFYALDEYPGTSHYDAHSGYYNTQNLNAFDDHPNPGSRVASIMGEAHLQNTAYANNTSSPSSLAMIGWQDTDADGVFNVLDVPLALTGSGSYDSQSGVYQFDGTSAVQTLPNENPIGMGHDITINTVDLIQWRLDDGEWVDGNRYGDYSATVSQTVPISGGGTHTIDFRTIVEATGVSSPLWSDTFIAAEVSSVPTDITLSSNSVGENLTVGAVVGQFYTTDSTPGDTHTYSFTSGTGSNDNGAFTLYGNELRSNQVFDYETKNSYSIRIRTTDMENQWYEEVFTITIVDTNEPPTVTLQNTLTQLDEGADTTQRIKTADIVITDDALGTQTLALGGADALLFEIDGTELYLKSGVVLNAEQQSQLHVVVQVNDPQVGTNPDDSDSLVITITPMPQRQGPLAEQYFDTVDPFDLAYTSLLFTPNADGSDYQAVRSQITDLPTVPVPGGTALNLADDDSRWIHLDDGREVILYGQTFDSFHVGSNGFVTFTGGDTDYFESMEDHFDTLRISALFNDLNPRTGGQIWLQTLTDRVVVTWEDIAQYGLDDSNTFQVTMYLDGRIQLAWTQVDCEDAIVGLSPGQGLPQGFNETDLSALPMNVLPQVQSFSIVDPDPRVSGYTHQRDINVTLTAAAENGSITGWMITESNIAPNAVSPHWLPQAPSAHTLTGPGDGSKTLYAWVKDNEGQVSTLTAQSQQSIILDTTAPTITITPQSTSDPTPDILGTVDDPTAHIEVTIAGQTYTAIHESNGSWRVNGNDLATPLIPGTYGVQARAVDPLGHETLVDSPNALVIVADNPSATLADIDTPLEGAVDLSFTVRFDSQVGIDVSNLDHHDIHVRGPQGFSQNATWVSVDLPSDGSPRHATYLVSAPGGAWDTVDNGTYTLTLQADQVGNLADPPTYVTAGLLGQFTVDIAESTPLPPVEQFGAPGNTFDLTYTSLLFTPNTDGSAYQVARSQITELPTAPGGTALNLGDDDAQRINLEAGQQVLLYGQVFDSFYIGSNGYITFSESDTDYYESLDDHFDTLRISALFDDLNPRSGGQVWFQSLTDRVVVTWEDIAQYARHDSNTFQVTMYFDGRHQLAWMQVDAEDAIVGLSTGQGVPEGLIETNFSALPMSELPSIQSFTIADPSPRVTGYTDQREIAVALTATADDSSITGWMVTESNIAPDAASLRWLAQAPSSYTIASPGDGSKTLYAWVQDSEGRVSALTALSQRTIILDTTAPVITITPQNTGDQTPDIMGTVDDPTAHIEVTLAGQTYEANHESNGTWRVYGSDLAAPLTPGTYGVRVHAVDPLGHEGLAEDLNALVIIEYSEPPQTAPTEQFTAGDDPFDLSMSTLLFTPHADGSAYQVDHSQITDLPTAPGGSALILGDDDSQRIHLEDGRQVLLYGQAFDGFYVSSNGYITFTARDTDYDESLDDHFDTLRISALFDDLNPRTGGQVWLQSFSDRVVVTWEDIEQFAGRDSNTFQVTMYFDGRLQVAWMQIDAEDAIVGLSSGQGLPDGFTETDFSG